MMIESMPVDYPIKKIQQDFPILMKKIRDCRLSYLDNGATTQKPQQVLDKIMHFYSHENANVHRGVHWLSEQATTVYENARQRVKAFVGAGDGYDLIFTKGTTESINLVAQTFGVSKIKKGDEIIISLMEHHSNWVPWQQLAQQVGATLKVIPLLKDGSCDQEAYTALLSQKTALLALTHTSNTLGSVNPVESMIKQAHHVGAKVLIDGAQAMPHQVVSLTDMDADFFAFFWA